MKSKTSKIFLTARWENLILISYKVSPEALAPYIPPHCEPDTIDGSAFVSLVPFDFNEIRVKSFRIPFHTNFPEINLRFYVRNNGRRGVVFIREFVPNRLVPFVANFVYNENYSKLKMRTSYLESDGEIKVMHNVKCRKSDEHISITAQNKPFIPPESSVERFFKEHKWGFGKSKKGGLLTYRVDHPVWAVYPVIDYAIGIDFGLLYGKNWEFLNNEKPFSIIFTKGSEVKIYSPEV